VLFIRLNESDARLRAEDLVAELNAVYLCLDQLLEGHKDCYKVETVGGEYVVASGVPTACPHHACALARYALDALSSLSSYDWSSGSQVHLRMGMHSGELVAGVAGQAMPRFRLFGDTVNTASRMKSKAKDGTIVVTTHTKEAIVNCCGGAPCAEGDSKGVFKCWFGGLLVPLGPHEVKGKGSMELWELRKQKGEETWPGALGAECASTSNPLSRVVQPHSSLRGVIHGASAAGQETLGILANLNHPKDATMEDGKRREIIDIVTKSVRDGKHNVWNNINSLGASVALQQHFPYRFLDIQTEVAYISVKNDVLLVNWKSYYAQVLAVFVSWGIIFIVSSLIVYDDEDSTPIIREGVKIVAVMHSIAILLFLPMVIFHLKIEGIRKKQEESEEEESEPENALENEREGAKMFSRFVQAILSLRFLFCVLHYLAIAVPIMNNHLLLDFRNMFSIVTWSVVPLHAFWVLSSILLVTSVTWTMAGITVVIVCYLVNFTTMMASEPPNGLNGICQHLGPEIIGCLVILMKVVWMDYLQRRYFISVIKAMKFRVLLEKLSQDLLPDHVLKRDLVKRRMQERRSFHGTPQKSLLSADNLTCGHLFADVAGFTKLCAGLAPEQAFIVISELFKEFDNLCAKWGVIKVETIGDAYWCASGVEDLVASAKDMSNLVGMALEMQDVLRSDRVAAVAAMGKSKMTMRIGIHYGPCVGCVVGSSAPRYHLFGPSIDVVQLLEQAGSKEGVVLSSAAAKVCLGLRGDAELDGAPAMWRRQGGLDALIPNTDMEPYSLDAARLQEIDSIFSGSGDERMSMQGGRDSVCPVFLVRNLIPHQFVRHTSEPRLFKRDSSDRGRPAGAQSPGVSRFPFARSESEGCRSTADSPKSTAGSKRHSVGERYPSPFNVEMSPANVVRGRSKNAVTLSPIVTRPSMSVEGPVPLRPLPGLDKKLQGPPLGGMPFSAMSMETSSKQSTANADDSPPTHWVNTPNQPEDDGAQADNRRDG